MNRLLLAIFMLLLSGAPALADGIYLAPPAYPVPPAIPAQRALFVPPHRFPLKTRLVRPFFAAGFLVTLVVATGALIYRQTLPQIEVIEHSGRSGRPLHAVRVMWDLTNYGKNIEEQTTEQVRAGIGAYFRSRQCVDPYFGRPVRWGDSPGDFLLIEDDRGLVLRGFSVRGEPQDAEWRPPASGD